MGARPCIVESVVTLRIGNNYTEEIVGDLSLLSPVEVRLAGCGAQRVAWFAHDGDVLVVPWEPSDDYIAYVTGLTRTAPETLRFVVPDAGRAGADVLTGDRLVSPGLHRGIVQALAGRAVDAVEAFYPDPSVAQLATSLNILDAMPGHGFCGQGGATLVNSKASFRAVASGVSVPIAEGAVISDPRDAADRIATLLSAGHCVIVKQEFHLGGGGNEILSPIEGVRAAGARHVVVLRERAEIDDYLERRWNWLTKNRRYRLVIERYHRDSATVYAEYRLSDDGIVLVGTGQMLMEPVVVGEIVPAPALSAQELEHLVGLGRRLCETYWHMGYRGVISADALLTADHEILFTEANGRVSGSTHMHECIRARVIGSEHADQRVLLERRGYQADSFGSMMRALADAGLGYDPRTRTGVIIICDFSAVDGTLRCCVVGQDLDAAYQQQRCFTDILMDRRVLNGAEQLR